MQKLNCPKCKEDKEPCDLDYIEDFVISRKYRVTSLKSHNGRGIEMDVRLEETGDEQSRGWGIVRCRDCGYGWIEDDFIETEENGRERNPIVRRWKDVYARDGD